MPLNGAGLANRARILAIFAEGATPDELTPEVAGDPIPFIHDGRTAQVRPTEAAPLPGADLAVFTRSAPTLGGVYTWAGFSWTVESVEADRAGGAAFPYRTVMVRHAV